MRSEKAVSRPSKITEEHKESIIASYSSGLSGVAIARSFRVAARTIYRVLRLGGVKMRDPALNKVTGRCTFRRAYLPTEEEIAEEARKIREEGFINQDGRYYPPWSDGEYLLRFFGTRNSIPWEPPVCNNPRHDRHKPISA